MPYKRALVTGFESWADNPDNPTIDIAEAMQRYRGKSASGSGIEVVTGILPVSFGDAPVEIRRLISKYGPDVVVETGLGAGREKIGYETRFRNEWYAMNADNNGFKPKGGKILRNGEDVLYATWPADDIVQTALHEGIPVEKSENARRYVCNTVAYLTMQHLGEGVSGTKAGFIHTPWTQNYAGRVDLSGKTTVKLDEAVRAVQIAVEQSL